MESARPKSSELVIFGLGANLGDREAFLRRAIELLYRDENLQLYGITLSSIVETPALLPPDAPAEWDIPFLNMVCAAWTQASAETVLKVVKRIENELGRTWRGHWGPREIDIDILALGRQEVRTQALTIPHPHMESREFVLGPLAEILPGWEHPVNGKTAKTMLEALNGQK